MSDFGELLEMLSEEEIDVTESAISQHVPPANPIKLDRETFARTRRVLVYAEEAMAFLSNTDRSRLLQARNSAINELRALRKDAASRFANRANGEQSLKRLYAELDDMATLVAPQVGVVVALRPSTKEDFDTLKIEIDAAMTEANRLLAEAAEAMKASAAARSKGSVVAAEGATETLAAKYRDLAQSHGTAAQNWLWGLAGLGLAALGLTTWGIVALSRANTSSDIVRAVGAKVAVAALVAFAVFFTSRNYRVNRHLVVAYESRATILDTARALRSSVEDPTAQATIMEAAVAAAFSVPDSGLVKHGGEDETQMAATIAMALSNIRRT